MWLSLDILFTKLFSFVVANEGELSRFGCFAAAQSLPCRRAIHCVLLPHIPSFLLTLYPDERVPCPLQRSGRGAYRRGCQELGIDEVSPSCLALSRYPAILVITAGTGPRRAVTDQQDHWAAH